MYLTDLAKILSSAGLKVVETPGWKTRGHGPLTAVKTITCHHTAGGVRTGNMPSLNTVINGRPGLTGPLCNLALGRDGTWYVVAAGVAYHAGVSLATSFTNEYAIGIEAENLGDGTDPWPAVQMEAYAYGCAALAEAYGLSTSRVLGHKETCSPVGRKSDPNFNMSAFRAKVEDIRTGADMPTAAEVAQAVWTTDIIPAPGTPDPTNPTWGPQNTLRYIANIALAARQDAADALATAKRTEAAINALAQALSPASLEAVVTKVLSTSAVDVNVNVSGKPVA